MTDEQGSEQNLIRVKADATGVDLSVGRSLPELIGRLLPSKFHIRRSVDAAITDRILDKVRTNADFDEAEVAFAEELLSDHARKFVRLKQIQQRARRLFEEAQPVLLIEAGANQNSAESETSDDWVNKFREDASLVDDELIREIYARVLSEEAQRPTAFSLRTLGVLRYLDREAATAFGSIQKVLLNRKLVPGQVAEDDLLTKFGLDHTTMLMLNDAGLVNASANSHYSREGAVIHFTCPGHGRVLAARREDNATFTASMDVHLLTPAGEQLARIAECEPDEAAFVALVSWLRPQLGGAELQVAKLPSRNWAGTEDELHWNPISTDDSPPQDAGTRDSKSAES
jgi:hypothetical protein